MQGNLSSHMQNRSQSISDFRYFIASKVVKIENNFLSLTLLTNDNGIGVHIS